ncbi:hypothetical protein BC332_31636 [Capsicum chinense]|nr:hypothetical protein BC332_31636 [Capsicum chinense]
MLAEEIAREERKLHLYKRQERLLQEDETSLTNHPQPLAFWQSTTSADEQLQKVRTTLREYRTLIQESENRLAELRRRNIFGTNPIIKWAEQVNMVYLNIELPEMVWPDARNLQINLAEGLLNISATIGAGPQIYQMNVHLRDRATLYRQRLHRGGRGVECTLRKQEPNIWGKLIQGDGETPSYVKRDWIVRYVIESTIGENLKSYRKKLIVEGTLGDSLDALGKLTVEDPFDHHVLFLWFED